MDLKNLSHKERFDISRTQWAIYAPLTLGCSSFTNPVDYSTFKKSKEEKAKVAEMKSELPKTRGYKFKTLFHGAF